MSAIGVDVGRIVVTDSTCIIKGQAWTGIPTLVWRDGIDEAASDWLRDLVVNRGVEPSSAEEYANILRPFLRFCRQKRRRWSTVDDDFIVVWREHLRRAMHLSVGRTNASLKVIFSLYRWAEEAGFLRYHVGIYGADEIPAELSGVPFPITAKRVFGKNSRGTVFGRWTTPLTLKDKEKGRTSRHTPTEAQIVSLHQAAVERVNGERDSLMLSWAEETGLRRAEILQVGKSHLPTPEKLAHIIEVDEPWLVSVRRKGGNTRPVTVPMDLIVRTLDYIEFDRRAIVEHIKGTQVGYREPDEVFLSSKTGLKLHPDSLTSIGRKTFMGAGVDHASIHRLRARFAIRTIETLVDAVFDGSVVGPESSWIETILVKAAEMMGHADPASLKPYLTFVLNRRIQTSDSSKAQRLATRLRQLELQEGTLVRRLQDHAELQAAALHVRSEQFSQAALLLRQLADRLESRQQPPSRASRKP